ncbi:hypothetical protein GETHLI_14400 [Geothrix limicola]|uniref:Uncharacterized protein n=1 Tax=Geothrix limicola TaxID=2927978 RepID=A0ABQ5QE47_9BACT|nr:hypothetical protein [Geothrix limicola]GLH72938.1 hypothetical protein GETHLI_14400 [Geothrix limicola]
MNQHTRTGRGRQVLTLAMIALPWFLRDQLATSLDENSRELQQVMVEAHNQEQREQQGDDLRELNRQLARIELRQKQSSGELDEQQVEEETAQLLSSTFASEGVALGHRVSSFEALLPRITMAESTRKDLADKGRAAGAVAKTLETFDAKAHHEHMDQLVAQWDQAESTLREAFDRLLTEAERERDSSARWATWSRFAAWAFTALAALSVGDWRKLLPGNSGTAEADQ